MGNTLKPKEYNMSKAQKQTKTKALTAKEVNDLCQAQSVYKRADFALKQVKEKCDLKSVKDGQYSADKGVVLKTTYTRREMNVKQLLEDYPEIDPEKYMVNKTITSVTITPLGNEDSLLKKLFN